MEADASRVIVARRLRAQRLTGAPCASPEEVVGLLGAVQAQDYGPAKWSVGMRAGAATDELVEAAFSSGAILRTHVLRPTWHFVLPADIRWLLTATGPRIQAANAGRYRDLGLDAATLRRSETVIGGALRGGRQLTRGELAALLVTAGIDVAGQRLPYMLMNGELQALICSGARRGKQHTYALLEERAPAAVDLPRDEALVELARRFFTSHGPATAKDFAGGRPSRWPRSKRASMWPALCCAARRPAGSLSGQTNVAETGLGAGGASASASPRVLLIQGYDEYIMGYSETKHVLARPASGWAPATPPVFRLVVLLNGRVAGFWRRTVARDSVRIDVSLLAAFSAPQLSALEAEAGRRYGAFLGQANTTLTSVT